MTRGRQRRKRRQQATRPPIRQGGEGGLGVWGPKPSRSDLRLIAQAANNDWPVPDAHRPWIVDVAASVIYDDDAPARLTLAAAAALIAMEGANIRAERAALRELGLLPR